MTDEPRVEFKIKEGGELVELLRLDKKGFLYKGEYIQDAGKAYNAFIETMDRLNKAKRLVIDTTATFAIGFAAGYALCYWGLS